MATPSSSSHSSSFPSGSNYNTTYVHAEPSTFKELVQKLTGLDGSSSDCPFKRPRLQERRRQPAKLEIELLPPPVAASATTSAAAAAAAARHNSCCFHQRHCQHEQSFGRGDAVLVSPVSIVDYSSFYLSSSPSPTTPSNAIATTTTSLEEGEEEEEEETTIARRGFYLHPSSKSYGEAPRLLPLFPLRSPQQNKPSY